MNRYKIFIFLLLGLTIKQTQADSPLTSTEFYVYYLDVAEVAKISETKTLSSDLLEYLLNDKNPNDVKVAMINALGWSSVISNSDVLLAALVQKYGNDQINSYSPADIMCYAYMSAMDDYFNVMDEVALMDAVVLALPESATCWMVWAMVKGQQMMDENWCGVWEATRTALVKSSDNRDFKTAAIQNIVDYTILYKEYCD